MPLLVRRQTTCAISGKVINEGDKYVCFQPFPCDPDNPAIVCSDACVLRDEFEKWEFKDNVITAVKDFLSQWYRTSNTFVVIYEDDDYLFVKSKIEQKVRIIFFRHAFLIDIPRLIWREFCTQLLGDPAMINILPYPTETLSFNKIDGIEICMRVDRGKDCIKLSLPEWLHFQSILAMNERLFD